MAKTDEKIEMARSQVKKKEREKISLMVFGSNQSQCSFKDGKIVGQNGFH